MKVVERIANLSEEQLKIAFDEFLLFREHGVIGKSFIRDLYDEHRKELGVGVGYWLEVERLLMGEIARRYYTDGRSTCQGVMEIDLGNEKL